jgi:hypothetical protein
VPGVTFVSALDALCRDGACFATAPSGATIEPIAWDNAHLTKSGARLLVDRILAGPLNAASAPR